MRLYKLWKALGIELFRKPEGDFRHVGCNKESDKTHDDKGHEAGHDLPHRRAEYAHGDENVEPEGRSVHAYRDVQNQDHSEVDWVDSEGRCNRIKKRRQHHKRRIGLQKHSCNKKDNVDQHQDHELRCARALYPAIDHVGNTADREDPHEDARGRDDDHDLCCDQS